jgi:hypothetical protein
MKLKLMRFIKPIYIISFIAFLALVTAVLIFTQYLKSQSQLKQLSQQNVDQTPKIIEQVNKLFQLPTEEIPTVATVTDKEKLKNQPFFTLAENGDNILIYLQAKKAILYRPSINKIIDIAPVNTSTSSATITPPSPKP